MICKLSSECAYVIMYVLILSIPETYHSSTSPAISHSHQNHIALPLHSSCSFQTPLCKLFLAGNLSIAPFLSFVLSHNIPDMCYIVLSFILFHGIHCLAYTRDK